VLNFNGMTLFDSTCVGTHTPGTQRFETRLYVIFFVAYSVVAYPETLHSTSYNLSVMSGTVSYETCPTSAPFFGFMGVTAALCFASKKNEKISAIFDRIIIL
jgi:uncharacterized membrane protein